MMEFSIPVVGDVAILSELPSNIKIGLGCVDVRFPEIDPVESIVSRVEKALPYVAAERISLNPDCGFAPGKDHEIPMEEAYAKLKKLGLAAKMLRERHGKNRHPFNQSRHLLRLGRRARESACLRARSESACP
jgi:5-methyltetrahydropteroyltriglutamate--homocysteine methyltransferase